MNANESTALLAGLTPAQFMQRHWQKKPLLIRGALPDFRPPLSIAEVKRLSRRDEVESRLVWREAGQWQMESGPFARLPPAKEREWSLLVQGVNLHDDAAAALMHRFRFVPDARLDDLMISIATDGGGVGPHFDSYDVFLLQAVGQRRWRIGKQKDLSLDPDAPLKILSNFTPTEEFVLNPGDMLYLPPAYAHDGIAEGECMTISIGFRSPSLVELARGMLEAAADQLSDRTPTPLKGYYRDPGQPAVDQPAALPETLVDAALTAAAAVPLDRTLASRFLGCWLTEPKPDVVFDTVDMDALPDLAEDWPATGQLKLDRRTLLIYRERTAFINGEMIDHPASAALRQLADDRVLDCADPACRKLTDSERSMLTDWLDDGWLHYANPSDAPAAASPGRTRARR
ncbi:JmjC domain-containing protein [Pigmentiphaga litoralis]|uniref:JmjC domain-containing protein n=1 Tax=Pigmentiphaga litoralis TaxID=516702 RepID=UPI003B42D812